MTDIKPIQTHYKGYLFRSRLEARWAVFFDEMGIKYEYEPEGYVLTNSDKYLPDYYLPDCETYVEVKSIGAITISGNVCGTQIGDGRENSEKYAKFSDEVGYGRSYMIVQGDPFDALGMVDPKNRNQDAGAYLFYDPLIIYKQPFFDGVGIKHNDIKKPHCREVGCFVNGKPFVVFSCLDDLVLPKNNTAVIAIDEGNDFMTIGCNDNDVDKGWKETVRSATIARQARFEHGERR